MRSITSRDQLEYHVNDSRKNEKRMPYYSNIPHYIVLSREPNYAGNFSISRKPFLVSQNKELRD